MAPSPALFVLLPALNERDALQKLIPAIGQTLQSLKSTTTICVIDDGSTDGTETMLRDLSQQWPVVCLRHPRNEGYGAALKTGFRWVLEQGSNADFAISLDADQTHLPEYIPEIMVKLTQGFDVVTASYSMPGARAVGVPPMRRLMSAAANSLLRLRYRIPGAQTYTNGYRGYRVEALRKAYARYGDDWMTAKNFSGGAELFINVGRCGARAGEIPFTLHYENRGRESKINIPRTVLAYLRLALL